jgi:hypothetical protein
MSSNTVTNAPIDTIKTRIQKASKEPGETAFGRIAKGMSPTTHTLTAVARDMFEKEGISAFWKGITPRVARVAPGQAVVFTIYEKVRDLIEHTHLPAALKPTVKQQ